MSPRRLVLFVLPFLFLIAFRSVLTVRSQEDSSPREDRWTLPIDASTLHPQADSFPQRQEALIPWSHVVFQSFRDENWEIYSARDDGSQLTRLTDDAQADLGPRLNRGANRIVFYSNRQGDYDIFIMNADGTGLRRLTDNGVTDRLPAWAPDGVQIVFESYVGDQAELFTIRRDGTGLTRLTNYAGYDGSAAWSPDGRKIAFCRGIGTRVYVHELDLETKAIRQLSTQRDSCDPHYSPDGKQILYDTDADGDGWYRPWVMNSDGSGQRELAVSGGGPKQDIFVNGWSPDSLRIVYTQIVYVVYQGQLYIWSIETWGARILNSADRVNLGRGELEANADWQTTDVLPPVSTVYPLPEFSRASGFTLRWTGSDQGASGLLGFNVQRASLPGASWETIRPEVRQTETVAGGKAGTQFGYRVSGFDHAFNHEPHPSQPEAFTTLYTSQLRTQVVDNRGKPIEGLTPVIQPAPVYSQPSGPAGRSLAYLSNQDVSLKAQLPGYGELPVSERSLPVDSSLQTYLPPLVNLPTNGQFESAPFPLAGWTKEGNLPIAPADKREHSGQFAAALGEVCTASVCISKPIAPTGIRWRGLSTIAVDDSNQVHMLFEGYSPVQPDVQGVYYAVRSADRKWSTPVLLQDKTASHIGTDHGFIEIGNDGVLHAAWTGPGITSGWYDAYYARKEPGKPWSAIETVSSDSPPGGLVVGPTGRVWVLIARSIVERIAKDKWETFGTFAEGDWNAEDLIATIDQNGTIHGVWQSRNSPLYDRQDVLVYEAFLPDGSKMGQQRLLTDLDHSNSLPSDLLIDGDGTLHLMVAFQSDPAPTYLYKPHGSAWKLAPEAEGIGNIVQMAIDSLGRIHAVGRYYEQGSYARYEPGKGWTAATPINGGRVSDSTFVTGPDGRLYLEAPSSSGGPALFESVQSEQTGNAYLSQTLNIPADMPNPTLAFMKQVLGDVPADNTGAFVRLAADGVSQDFPISGDAEWSLGWVDASPWKGKTVTVTFGVHQTADAPHLQLLLDAVSLGPAYADTMTTIAGPLAALPGEEVAYVLTAGNLGGVGSGPVTLNLTLPAGMTLVQAIPAPVVSGQTLRWDFASLPAGGSEAIQLRLKVQAAQLGIKLDLSATLATEPAEPEASNNTATATLFVGMQALAPMITRP